MINLEYFLHVLPYMGYGMLGIFLVVLLMIAFTYGMTILFTLADRKRKARKNK